MTVLQCSGEVGDEVIDVLDADAQAEHVRVDSCGNLLLRAQLRVRGRCRMHDERLRVTHAANMQYELQTCHKLCSRLKASLHTECKHTSESILEVLASKFMVRVALETRIIHALHCRMLFQEFRNSEGVLAATLGTKRKGLESLKHQE